MAATTKTTITPPSVPANRPGLPKWVGIGIPIAVVVVLLLLSCIRIIGVGQVGVVTRFGHVTGRELGEGIHLKLPWPVERVAVFDVKVQKEQTGAAAASLDLQDVNATLALNYHLERGKVNDIYQTIGTEYKERIIDPSLQESFKAATAKYSVSELITKREEVKQDALKTIKSRLEPRGIVVDDLSIVNFAFSEQFTEAIEAKQVAQQDAERAAFNLQRARQDAEAQRAQRETLSAELLQKQAIEKWDGRLPTYLGNGTVFNIPLGTR